MILTPAERRSFWLAAYAAAYSDECVSGQIGVGDIVPELPARRAARASAVADEALASLSELPQARVPGGST